MVQSLTNIFQYTVRRNIWFIVILWFTLAFAAVLAELFHHSINNYLIFKNVFWHTIEQRNLYAFYPTEYNDINHYGPLFSLIIFPFAVLPDFPGVILWVMMNAFLLWYAIQQLEISGVQKNTILLISAVEMMTSMHNVQSNAMLTSLLILCCILVRKEKEWLVAFLVIAGFLMKVYGIAGIVFFLFSKHKLKFSGYLLFWLVVLFCVPMLISSPAFIWQTYQDWLGALIEKNSMNIQLNAYGIDISVMGLIRRIFILPNLSNYYILIPAAVILCIPLIRVDLFHEKRFMLYYLCVVLISVVIFSSSSESPTYVIAVVGVAIWYSLEMHRRNPLHLVLLMLVLLFTSFSSTDLFPDYIKSHFIIKYSLKALPCFLVWLFLMSRLIWAPKFFFTSNQTYFEKENNYGYPCLQ